MDIIQLFLPISGAWREREKQTMTDVKPVICDDVFAFILFAAFQCERGTWCPCASSRLQATGRALQRKCISVSVLFGKMFSNSSTGILYCCCHRV